jgi:hypothetical protein
MSAFSLVDSAAQLVGHDEPVLLEDVGHQSW